TLFREVGVEHEEWDRDTIRQRVPYISLLSFWPPSRPDSDPEWIVSNRELDRALFTPGAGFVSDPQLAAQNLQVAAERLGAEFRFNARVVGITRNHGRAGGVALSTGEHLRAPIVVNVAGPHSFVINRMAGVEEEMRIKTRALRHEVHHVPAPAGLDYE